MADIRLLASQEEAQKQAQLQAARETAKMAERQRIAGFTPSTTVTPSAVGVTSAEQEKALLADNVKLSDGTWVTKEEFYKLSEDDQSRLMRLGVQGFNNYYAQKDREFRANNVQLKDGSWVDESYYNKLSDEDRSKLYSMGIDNFNKYQQEQFDIFKQNNVQLDDGSWIGKADYDNLNYAWQVQIKNLGVEGFNNWLKTAYGGASELVQVTMSNGMVEVYGETEDPNIGINAYGDRIYIGGRWPDSVSTKLTKGEPLSSRWPTEVSTFQPVTPATHVQVGKGVGAEAEWVTEALYEEIGKQSLEGQKVLKEQGIQAYQGWAEQQAKVEQVKFEQENVKVGKDEYMAREDYVKLSPEAQSFVDKEGVTAYNEKINKEIEQFKKDHVQVGKPENNEWIVKTELEALPVKMREAVVKNGVQAINISHLKPDAQFEMMKQWELVDKDAKFAGIDEDGQILIQTGTGDKVVSEAWYKKFLTKEFAKGVAIGMVPIAGTMYFWKEMKPWERGLSIALDVATLIPFVGAVSVGVRAGKGVAVSVGRAMLAEFKAPVTALLHPVATIKAGVRPIKVLLSSKKIPLAAGELRSSSIFFDAEKVGNAKTAMQARDALTEAAIMGKKPAIEIAGKKLELAKVALNQKAKPVGIHTTYDIRPYLNGADVRTNKEGYGIFIDSSLHSEYTPASALGYGLTPTPDVSIWELGQRTVNKIGKYHPQDILGLDKPAFRSLNFADATAIPADLAAPMKKIVQEEKGILFGSFVEHLKSPGAKLPHDADMGFLNPQRAQMRLVEMAKSRGYNAVPVGEAIGVVTKGKYAKANYIEFEKIVKSSKGKSFLKQLEISGEMDKLGDAKGMDRMNEFYETHGLKPVGYDEIDGVRVTKLGEQYLRQAFGAIDPTLEVAKHTKRVKKVKLMAGQIEDLIKDAGFTKKMPGALLIRDEKLLKAMQPSDKITRYGVELEETIPFGKIDKPSQILEMYSPTGDTIYLAVIGKPFTSIEIAKFKLIGAVDTIRDIFRPVLKIDNKAIKTMDRMNRLAAEARKLEKAIRDAGNVGDTIQEARLRKQLSVINSESRAIARTVDAQNAARVGIRIGAVATEDFIDKISFRELARTKPTEVARVLVDLPRADRTRILNELDRPSRVRVESELSRLPTRTTERGVEDRQTLRADRPVERVEGRAVERVTERIPGRQVPELVTRIPSRVTDRIPGRGVIPEKLRVPPPVPLLTTTLELPDGKRLELTKGQMDGIVAWKQGKLKRKGGELKPFYWMKYPDKNGRYPDQNTIHTTDPIEGVKYEEGIGSVAKSIIKKYGEIPKELQFSMGIQGVTISRDRQAGIQQPKIKFGLKRQYKKGRSLHPVKPKKQPELVMSR